MPRKFANRFTTTLAAPITDTDVTLTLASNPTGLTLAANEFVVLTLINGSTVERLRATSVVGTAVSGITRAWGPEGTTASGFPANSVIKITITAAALDEIRFPHKTTTVSLATAVVHQHEFTITDVDAVTARRVVIQLEPNDNLDLDQLADYTVRAAVLTDGTISGVLSSPDALVGDFLLSYTLE